LFDLIAQRAAVDGLSEAELQFLNDVAFEWGLVDEATHKAVKSIDTAMMNLAQGNIQEAYNEITRLRENAEDTAGTYNINYKITTTGTPPKYEPGLKEQPIWKALGGPVDHNSAYIVGEQGPERFIPSRSGFIMPNDETTRFIQGLQVNIGGGGFWGSLPHQKLVVHNGLHLHNVQNAEKMLLELSRLYG
jgi:hypothetical protein